MRKINKYTQKIYTIITIQRLLMKNLLNSFKYFLYLKFVFIAVALIIIEDL